MDIGNPQHSNPQHSNPQHSNRRRSDPPARIEYVSMPDALPANGATAFFDSRGQADPSGNVMISTIAVSFIWARFLEPVKAGQIASMIITNVNAATIMDGAATEWDLSANQPTFGQAIISLLSVERGLGSARITCRNTSDSDLWIAAGLGVPILPAGAIV